MSEVKKFPLTQQAYDRLKEELAHLEGDARKKVIEQIATARAHGDLSENAEYHASKEQQGFQEARVRQIKEMLENVEIIEIIEAADDGVVKPGVLITIRIGDDDAETYLLGSREEKGAGHEILTPESPMGQALIGHSAGETVVAEIPTGELKVEIIEVRSP